MPFFHGHMSGNFFSVTFFIYVNTHFSVFLCKMHGCNKVRHLFYKLRKEKKHYFVLAYFMAIFCSGYLLDLLIHSCITNGDTCNASLNKFSNFS